MVIDRPWVLPLVIGVVIAAIVLAAVLPRRPEEQRAARWVANSAYIRRLPAYRRRMRLLQVGLVTLAGFGLLAVAGAGLLLARVVDRDVRAEELASRDIVLCLDVSGSMIEFGAEMADKFVELVENFDGERIALSVWNSTSRTVFPLTDDYPLVVEELAAARAALDFDLDAWVYDEDDLARLEAFIAGTITEDVDASSIVGDGLATCTFAFDEQDDERSRSIILVTDNEVFGEGVYDLQEAAELADERDIRIHGLFAASPSSYSQDNVEEYERVITSHGGLFYHADDPGAVDGIVEAIAAEQAAELLATPEVVLTDRPETVLWLAVLGVGGLIVMAWRLRV